MGSVATTRQKLPILSTFLDCIQLPSPSTFLSVSSPPSSLHPSRFPSALLRDNPATPQPYQPYFSPVSLPPTGELGTPPLQLHLKCPSTQLILLLTVPGSIAIPRPLLLATKPTAQPILNSHLIITTPLLLLSPKTLSGAPTTPRTASTSTHLIALLASEARDQGKVRKGETQWIT